MHCILFHNNTGCIFMFRIGIIGTESSHALAFAKYYNLPDPETGKTPYEDIRVVAVYGTDQAANEQIVNETGVACIAQSVDEILDQVDAVMITSRKGSEHMTYALPFIERRIPLFIDKPFTSDPAEADMLMTKILAHNCPVMGGSACKYLADIAAIKALVRQLQDEGRFVSASMSFRIELNSPFDGIYFYSPHLVEMCLEVFGFDVKKIQAMRTGKDVLVNVQYENFAVSLQFVRAGKQSCLVFGTRENYHFDIDTTGLYALEASRFAELLYGTRESLSADQLVKPVHFIAAIEKSMNSGVTVTL